MIKTNKIYFLYLFHSSKERIPYNYIFNLNCFTQKIFLFEIILISCNNDLYHGYVCFTFLGII